MRMNENPRSDSYEGALTHDQRISLYELLATGATLAQAQEKAPPWPSGPETGNKPSLACLSRLKLKLRLRQSVDQLETKSTLVRLIRDKLQRMAKGTDQELLLDEVMTLIGHEIVEGCLGNEKLSVRAAAAWLLLRRAELRRYDQRLADAKAQKQADKPKQENPPAPMPPMDKEAKAEAFRRIFGIKKLPLLSTPTTI